MWCGLPPGSGRDTPPFRTHRHQISKELQHSYSECKQLQFESAHIRNDIQVGSFCDKQSNLPVRHSATVAWMQCNNPQVRNKISRGNQADKALSRIRSNSYNFWVHFNSNLQATVANNTLHACSLNIRGTNDCGKRDLIDLWGDRYNIKVMAIQESKINSNRTD